MIIKSNKEIPDYIKILIKNIEKAPDFCYDDEECELTEWCKENRFNWCWDDSLFNNQVLITNNESEIKRMAEIRKIEYIERDWPMESRPIYEVE